MSIFYNPRDVTFTIGGEKFKGVLTKDLEMKNKNRYVPDIGENLEFYRPESDEWLSGVLVAIDDDYFIFREVSTVDGYIYTAVTKGEFRPIINKEKEELNIIGRIIYPSVNLTIDNSIEIAKEIQKAGFTIPKKVKRSEIADVVANTSPMISVEDLVDEICNLLGDLVEDDQ
jgi:hypothetical protein